MTVSSCPFHNMILKGRFTNHSYAYVKNLSLADSKNSSKMQLSGHSLEPCINIISSAALKLCPLKYFWYQTALRSQSWEALLLFLLSFPFMMYILLIIFMFHPRPSRNIPSGERSGDSVWCEKWSLHCHERQRKTLWFGKSWSGLANMIQYMWTMVGP